jgi:hypothetical protein
MRIVKRAAVVTLLLATSFALAVDAREPAPVPAESIYYAYYVRTTVLKYVDFVGGKAVYTPTVIVEGPLTLAEGIDKIRDASVHGICVIQPPSTNVSGGANCYPPHLIQKADITNTPEGKGRR